MVGLKTPNKSDIVRAVLLKHGIDTPTREVIEILKKQHVKVTPSCIPTIRKKLKGVAKHPRKKRDKMVGNGRLANPQLLNACLAHNDVTLDHVLLAKEFVRSCGSRDVAEAAIQELADILE